MNGKCGLCRNGSLPPSETKGDLRGKKVGRQEFGNAGKQFAFARVN